jgi:hypothetical protein
MLTKAERDKVFWESMLHSLSKRPKTRTRPMKVLRRDYKIKEHEREGIL